MTKSNKFFVGIDVSKHKLDVASSNIKRVQTIQYSEEALQQLLLAWKEQPPELICLEATGGLERQLLNLLHEHKLHVAVVNPRQIRDFAKAHNQLAKTDAIDARVIALFAQKVEPRQTAPLTASQQRLRDLTARKRQVNKLLVQEKNRLSRTVEADIRLMIQQAIEFYQTQLNALAEQQQILIQADELTQHKTQLIESVPGLGTATASLLISELPELGTLNRQQIARLIGVAPTNRDSGTLRGKRTTGGGRVAVRNALYMPTVVALKHNPKIKRFYERLLQNGRPKMVALIAAMRKLITILNVMIRNNQSWQNQPLTS